MIRPSPCTMCPPLCDGRKWARTPRSIPLRKATHSRRGSAGLSWKAHLFQRRRPLMEIEEGQQLGDLCGRLSSVDQIEKLGVYSWLVPVSCACPLTIEGFDWLSAGQAC
eukprot:4652746-Amphidinium_carterae.2